MASLTRVLEGSFLDKFRNMKPILASLTGGNKLSPSLMLTTLQNNDDIGFLCVRRPYITDITTSAYEQKGINPDMRQYPCINNRCIVYEL